MRKLLLPLLAILLFTSCQKQIPSEQVQKEILLEEFGSNSVPNIKVKVCHQNGLEIVIDEAALIAHIAHGDAVDMDKDGFFDRANPCSATDCDDNTFSLENNCNLYVTICNQVWMVRNLDVTTYRNGDPIPQVTDPAEWVGLTTGAWCYYENNPTNGSKYGKLYNWYAVNDPRGLAPTGWHIPTEAEWVVLSNCLGGALVAGGKMKSTGTVEAGTGLWNQINTGATNSSGFTGLPGGYRDFDGIDGGLGDNSFWWSSSQFQNIPNIAFKYILTSSSQEIAEVGYNVIAGQSVRCVKD